jgi:flagellar hook-length control protein FliK
MTNVQLNLTSLLLPAGPAAGGEGTGMKNRPARPPQRAAPAADARGRRLEQASSTREDARGAVRRDAADRRTDPKSRPPAAKGAKAKPARQRSTRLRPHSNPQRNVLAHLARGESGPEGRISFDAIIEGLVDDLAQAAPPGSREPHARLVKHAAAGAIKAAGASLPQPLAALKLAAPKAAGAKAAGPAEKPAAATAQAAAKLTSAAAQAAELAGEAVKPEHSAAPAPTHPSPQAAPSAPTGTPQQKASQATSPTPAAPLTDLERTKETTAMPAAADLPTERASAAGKDITAGEVAAWASPSAVSARPASEDGAPRPRATAGGPAGQEPEAIPHPSASAGAPPTEPAAAGAASEQAGPVVARQAEALQAMHGDGLGIQSAELMHPEQAPSVQVGAEAMQGPEELRGQLPAADQIIETIRLRDVRAGEQIVVRLNPPELGRVRLTLRAEGQELRGLLEVDNSRTLMELQREAPALADRLAEGGVELRRLDVQLSDQGRSDSTDSPPQQGADSGQGLPQRDAPDRGSGSPADPADLGAGDLEPEESPEQQVADESINIWM